VDHGTDLPRNAARSGRRDGLRQRGPAKKCSDICVEILDLIAEDDGVVFPNRWTGTEAARGKKFESSGIVIGRVTHRQLVERWACLIPLKLVEA